MQIIEAVQPGPQRTDHRQTPRKSRMPEPKIHRLRLSLRQLETFVATATAGSTRAAADKVARSQSATSVALAELEASLGVALFDRVARRLVLNENGRLLLPHAATLLDKALEIEALFDGEAVVPLRVASSFTIGEYLMPTLIAGWKGLHPSAQVQLDVANTRAVLESVATMQADVGFIEGSHTHPSLKVEHWLEDELVVVSAPGVAWGAGAVSNERLARATWIMREAGSGTREAADRFLIPALGHLSLGLELGSNEAVKRAVASGLGLGCLSWHAVQDAVAYGWLAQVPTRLPKMRRTLAIVTHRDKPVGSTAQAFLAHCQGWAKAQGSEPALPHGET